MHIINSISKNLIFNKGIWFSKMNSEISYPEEGNELCYQIEENSFWFKHRNNCIKTVINKFITNLIFTCHFQS